MGVFSSYTQTILITKTETVPSRSVTVNNQLIVIAKAS